MRDATGTDPESVTVSVAIADAELAAGLSALLGAHERLAWASPGNAALVVADAAGLATVDPRALVVLLGGTDLEATPAAVRAILPEDAAPTLILAAIELVLAGLTVLPERGFGPLPEPAQNGNGHEADADRAPLALTAREAEVLQLLAAGASNKMIARRLGVSVHTAKFHVASLTRKLGASGRLEAVGIGVRLGLVMI